MSFGLRQGGFGGGTLNDRARFWSHVDLTDAYGEPVDGCWLWTASTDKDGYGQFWLDGTYVRPHRFSYSLAHGPIPEGRLVLHHCDVAACVNPSHLFLGTQADNMGDKTEKMRQAYGERHGRAKLTVEQVREIRALLPSSSKRSLARAYGVAPITIQRIETGKNWGLVP